MASVQTRSEQTPSTASVAVYRATRDISGLRQTAAKHAAKESMGSKLANALQKLASCARKENSIQRQGKQGLTAVHRARAGPMQPWARRHVFEYARADKSTLEGRNVKTAPQVNSAETISMQNAKYARTDTFLPPQCPRSAIDVLPANIQMQTALPARHVRATRSALAAPWLVLRANRENDRLLGLMNACLRPRLRL